MLLKSMSAAQYRSLRAIRMDLNGVNVFIGANGVGKTNLYRGLQLVQAAVRGTFAREIAAEGGMMQALWAGPRRKQEKARLAFSVQVEDEASGLGFSYRIEAGFRPPPPAAGFVYEPHIKLEEFSVNMARSGDDDEARGAGHHAARGSRPHEPVWRNRDGLGNGYFHAGT